MVAPFLDLLFLKTDKDYAERIAKGAPELALSVDSLVDNFYFYFTSVIVDPEKGKMYALIDDLRSGSCDVFLQKPYPLFCDVFSCSCKKWSGKRSSKWNAQKNHGSPIVVLFRRAER
jgi:hypothetical protein